MSRLETSAPPGKPMLRSAMTFVIVLSSVSFFSDMNYEGARSIAGQFLQLLGSNAATVGITVGAGEFLGYALRFLSGYWADRSGRYWTVALCGYCIQLFAMPLLAFVGAWQAAVAILFLERIGKGIRNPARDAMLSFATGQTGRGWVYGLHAALDQFGALLGPLLISLVLSVDAVGGDKLAGYQRAFAVLFAPAVLALTLLLIARHLFPHPQHLESKTPVAGLERLGRRFWLYCVGGGLIGAGFADFALMAFHFKHTGLVSDKWIPALFSFAAGIDAVTSLVAGRIYDRRPMSTLFALFGAGAVFAPFVFLGHSLGVVLIGLALWGIGLAGQEAILKAALVDLIPTERRAHGFGTFALGFGIAWFAGSALMGVLYDHAVTWLVAFSMASGLLALPFFWFARGQPESETRW
jgi:MFS family permease